MSPHLTRVRLGSARPAPIGHRHVISGRRPYKVINRMCKPGAERDLICWMPKTCGGFSYLFLTPFPLSFLPFSLFRNPALRRPHQRAPPPPPRCRNIGDAASNCRPPRRQRRLKRRRLTSLTRNAKLAYPRPRLSTISLLPLVQSRPRARYSS